MRPRGKEEKVATLVERSLVLVKPDGVKRALIGTITDRIERKGIRIAAMDLRTLPRELVEEHYAEHQGKPFFEPLVSFMLSGPVVAMVIEGHRCIEAFRTLSGATDPVKAAPGTIRGDLATDVGTTVVQNLVHGSDSPASAEREIKLFFPDLA
ncbi:nucleoside-diphosphate kinase [Actinospica durhamensis]|uniref:Nucleoside diphosphate kinase n=1 Tax=Actinospica durhamensis TaxID=1508375 RepID=A0A941EK53_9ACTN|nr:nucleoside-diphosphate kinase [Actinospica durhamensis]